MSGESIYSMKNIREIKWYEHIRLRPGMYVGQVNEYGFVGMLKELLSAILVNTGTNMLVIELRDELHASIRFDHVNTEVQNNWSAWERHLTKSLMIQFFALNALSKTFSITFYDQFAQVIAEQDFNRGVQNQETEIEAIKCSAFEVVFQLDRDIWGKSFQWNSNYITHHIREYAYLHKSVKFELKYKVDSEACRNIYYFRNGLKDKIQIEFMNGPIGSDLDTWIDEQLAGFYLEAAFTLRLYSEDESYLRSYVNDCHTSENGTHVDGLLQGMGNGILKYLEKNGLTTDCQITEQGIREHLIAIVNIRMEAPVFSGCTKNKLANPEVTEPIASYVAELLFRKMEADPKAAESLISAFSIYN